MRRAFTLLEILVVMSIIGILSGLAAPQYQHLRRKALAAKVVGDIHAVRIAAFSYYGDARRWPREQGRGRVPRELRGHLPQNFSFRKPEYVLDWENWGAADFVRRGSGEIVGVSIVAKDRRLLREVGSLLGDAVAIDLGDRRTFFFDGF